MQHWGILIVKALHALTCDAAQFGRGVHQQCRASGRSSMYGVQEGLWRMLEESLLVKVHQAIP
eukprot:11484490-Prorocentrum_lima.AAC.1